MSKSGHGLVAAGQGTWLPCQPAASAARTGRSCIPVSTQLGCHLGGKAAHWHNCISRGYSATSEPKPPTSKAAYLSRHFRGKIAHGRHHISRGQPGTVAVRRAWRQPAAAAAPCAAACAAPAPRAEQAI